MTNLTNKLAPLTWSVPIVDGTGRPTPEFMRKWAQQQATNATIIDLSNAAGVSAVLDLLGSAKGDTLYRSASAWTVLAPGANGTVLSLASGIPSWVTESSLLDALGSAAQGDVLYRDSAVWKLLAPSTSGYVLTTQGASANPVWAPASGGFVVDVETSAATTAAGDTSGLTYNNGASGVGATFTGSVNTVVTIDGFTFTAVGQTLLVKNDTQSPSGAFNGIYKLTVLQTSLLAPVFTRDTSYDTPAEINETGLIAVLNGTANQKTTWLQTATIVTVGTTPLVYAQYTKNPDTLVFTTGSPASGNLTKFSDSTSITNGDLSGDVTTSGSLVTTVKSSVALAGSPTTTTQSPSDNSTKVATTAYVDAAIAVGGGGGGGGFGFFSPLMQRLSYFFVTTTLTALADVVNAFGSAGGSGGSQYWGVTPLAAGTASGNTGTASWYTSFGTGLRVFFNLSINQITNIRCWFGISSQSGAAMGNSDAPGGTYVGFRFSSNVPDSHWIAMVNDGSGPSTADTGVAPTTTAQQEFAIVLTGSAAKFYIAGALVATLSTHLPPTSTAMTWMTSVNALTSTGAKSVLGYSYVFQDLK